MVDIEFVEVLITGLMLSVMITLSVVSVVSVVVLFGNND
jgi:hypothetical protein